MQRIDIPGVGLVDFPDSMTDEQITEAIERDILKTTPKEEEPSFVDKATDFATSAGRKVRETVIEKPLRDVLQLGSMVDNRSVTSNFDRNLDGAAAKDTGFDQSRGGDVLKEVTAKPVNTLKKGSKIVDGVSGVAEVGLRKGYAGIGRIEAGALDLAADVFDSDTLRKTADNQKAYADEMANSAVLRGTKSTAFEPDSIAQEVPQVATDALGSVITTAPALATGVLTGGATIPAIFATSSLSEYGADSDLNGAGKAMRALGMGAAEALGEKLGGTDKFADALTQVIGGKNKLAELGVKLLTSGAKEIPSEEITTTAQFLLDKNELFGLNQDATLDDYIEQVKNTAKVAALQGSGMAGAGGLLRATTEAGNQPKNSVSSGSPEVDATAAKLQQQYEQQNAAEEADAALAGISEATSIDDAISLASETIKTPLTPKSEAIPASELLEETNVSPIDEPTGVVADASGSIIDQPIGSAGDSLLQSSDTVGTGLDSNAATLTPGSGFSDVVREGDAGNAALDQQTDLIQTPDLVRKVLDSNPELVNQPIESPEEIVGKQLDKEWTAFAQESGSLGIPRAEMPQIKAENRGAMTNFLNARGIDHIQEALPASELKPTQLEFSQRKVEKAKLFKGGDRSILISADNHVLDGHHQWMAKLSKGENVDVIRLDAPIAELLEVVKEFPSATVGDGATPPVEVNQLTTSDVVDNAQPIINDNNIRPLVERLVKRRAAAAQTNMRKGYDTALQLAKDMMAGKQVSANKLKTQANLFRNKDKEISDILTELANQVASAPATLAASERKSELAKDAISKRMKLDVEKDGLMEAIAKIGGLNNAAAQSEFGIDPADMKQFGAGILRTFKSNGLDADTLRELLAEQGYPVGETVADLGNAIAEAMAGNDVLTAAGQEALARKKLEEYELSLAELSDNEQQLLDDLIAKATSMFGADVIADVDAAIASSMTGQPQGEIERALIKLLQEEFSDEGNQTTSSGTAEGPAAENTESGSGQADERSAQQSGSETESQRTERRVAGDERVERRADTDTRKKVTDMSADEMRRALLIDDLTGIGNRRAYDEAVKKPFQVSIDADGLKWINDNLGHESGDILLGAIGEAIGRVSADSFHISGDEFIVQGDTEESAASIMQDINNLLAEAVVEGVNSSGDKVTLKGIGISYGIAKDLKDAENKLQQHKSERETAGLRSGRGEQPANATVTSQRSENNQDNTSSQTDLLGQDTTAQQAIADAEKAKDAKRNSGNDNQDTFNLTGSDSEADKAASAGAQDLFAEAGQKIASVIMDLGEKIGGARKDNAATGMTKSKRSNSDDDRPKWAKRYMINQIADVVEDIGGKWTIRDKLDKDSLGQPRQVGGRNNFYDTKEAAEAALPELAVGRKHKVYSTAQRPDGTTGYEIYRNINDRKRVKIVDQIFDDRVKALEYLRDHAAEILETNTTFGETDLPTPDNTDRIGEARRDGDVDGGDFMKAFGLRGVEFGNWNNQIERQQLMNAAYDGLIDLAEVLNIPTKALGLNGDLALAFGARGQGLSSAKAHYESNKTVINLTKMNGAGSLAHEWFHALDHYLGRLDSKASSIWEVDSDGTRSLKAKGADRDFASFGFSYKSNVRPEVREAYTKLIETMVRKAQVYLEDTNRADEFVARTKENLATGLDALRTELSQQKDPKYWKRKNAPASAEQLIEFDTIAEQLLNGQGLDAQYRAVESKTRVSKARSTNDALEKLSALYQAVRGRSGFDSTNNHGVLDRLRGDMSRYSQRLKMLAEAQQGNEKIKQVPTEFAMNAKELDQGRGTDYWTTLHEMAARAFQGYVEDKVAETGGSSPFLNYGREGAGILTPWGVKFPFPRGEERKAINQALSNFVDALQTKETDQGVALFSRSAMKSVDANIARGEQSMNEALINKADVKRGMYNTELGWIDLVWGNELKGIKHIIKQRMVKDGLTTDEVYKLLTKDLVKTIASGQIIRNNQTDKSSRLVIKGDANEAVLVKSKGENGWLLTGFKLNEQVNQGGGATIPSLRSNDAIRSRINEVAVHRELSSLASGNVNTSFSRSDESIGMPKADVNKVVTKLSAKWNNAPQIVAVDDMNDSAIPQPVRDENERQLSQGANGQPDGFFYKGKVYVVASQMNGASDVQRVVFHETLGHFGLRGTFGKDMEKILNEVATLRRPLVAAKAKQYGLDMSVAKDRLIAAEEVLAEMAQANPQIGFVKRAIAAIRQWLRDNGFKLQLTDDDIIANYLLPARQFVERGGKEQTMGDMVGAFARNNVIETESFKRWFGDSKVVDEDGKPLVVYHSTDADFKEFWTNKELGAHFGVSPEQGESIVEDYDPLDGTEGYYEGANTMPSYIKIEKPLDLQSDLGNWDSMAMLEEYLVDNYEIFTPKEFSEFSNSAEVKKGLMAKGYDGIRYYNSFEGNSQNNSEQQAYIVFTPNQIKSAIGNNGDFDSNNDDIRFSRQGALTPQWQSLEDSKLDTVIQALQDKNIDLKRVSQNIKKASGDIDDRWNAYLQEELYHGRTAKRTQDFIKSEIEPLINEMRLRGVNMPDFEEYLWARHAEERNLQIAKINPDMPDGGSGMTTQEANDYLAGLDADKKKTYETLAKRIDGINKTTRQLLVSYGLESTDAVEAMESTYKKYVPLQREDMDIGGGGTGQGFSIKGSSTKRAMGSNKNVVDIIANIAMQREKIIVRGEKNRVSTALIGLAKLNPSSEFWEVDTPPTIRNINKSTGLVEEYTDPNYKNRDNVVVARIVNKLGRIEERSVVFNEFDDRAMRMAGSIKNLDVDNIEPWLESVSMVTRYFASINTQYNPIFGVINITRDVQGALLNLSSTELAGKQKQVLSNVLPALAGIYKDVRSIRKGNSPAESEWAQLWEEFQKEGGQTGFRDLFKSAADRGKAIEKALDPSWWTKTLAGKIVTLGGVMTVPETAMNEKAIKPVFDWLSDYNQTLENAVRLSVYKVAIENGQSKQRAASIAKNISVNFNRKGSYGRSLGSLYAFFNASTQGTARIAETLTGPAGKQIIAGGVFIGVMQAVALALSGYDEEEPPEFVRDRNLIIPLDFTGADGKYVTVPMPLGFNVLPNFGRIATEWMLAGFEDTPKRLTHIFSMMMEMFNPVGGNGSISSIITPTAFDPFNDLDKNKDWTGRDIARKDFNSLDPTPGFSRTRDKAWSVSVELARYINALSGGTDYTPGEFSPTGDQIEYLAGQVTGGVGREVIKTGVTAEALITGEDLPMYKVPLLGRFVGNSKGQAPQGGKFYNNLIKLNKLENEIMGRDKDGKDITTYIEEHPEVEFIEYGKRAYKEILKLRKVKAQMVDQNVSRAEIKAIDDRITEIMTEFNNEVANSKEKAAAE